VLHFAVEVLFYRVEQNAKPKVVLWVNFVKITMSNIFTHNHLGVQLES
jgi:hypothetical protein